MFASGTGLTVLSFTRPFVALIHACLVLLASGSASVQAATLFAIVSGRNASDAAQSAASFRQLHPQHHLVFRTSAQVDAMPEAQLQELVAGADALLFATVFKDTAARLIPILQAAPATEIIAVAGDPKLGRLNRWRGESLFQPDDPRYDALSSLTADKDATAASIAVAVQANPTLAPWIRARGYWQNRGEDNLVSLFSLLLSEKDGGLARNARPIQDTPPVRFRLGGEWLTPAQLPQALKGQSKRVIAVLDDQHADGQSAAEVSRALCSSLEARNLGCVTIHAGWGKASSDALATLRQTVGDRLGAIVSLQDFVIGGSTHRDRATRQLEELDVPVFKAIRLPDVTAAAWRSSEQGLSWDSVYYRVSMPELQGISQPMVVATAGPPQIDASTGIEVSQLVPVPAQIDMLTRRAARWVHLRDTANANKHIAIVYYNHPPGRHNIGADNLDVPASLLEILRGLRRDGYQTGKLPETSAELLSMLQKDGVNLPEQGEALKQMASHVTTVSAEQYGKWFQTLPETLRREMVSGPLGVLQSNVRQALAARLPEQARGQVTRTLQELRHLVEGAQHANKARALDLLDQLKQGYESVIVGGTDYSTGYTRADALTRALVATGIEGLRGWGEPPGYVMVVDGRQVLPGLRFGNVFIGPQPPRGWELNEELLHANTSVPPTHQYLGFYFWLRNEFKADAIVHLGRHSTYEFLPRKSVGQDENDYPQLIAADIPGVYPYIVDGVGEGLQAKRRGLAVMIDHLIPPLTATPLYDDLLRLRQLVESYETALNPALRKQATAAMRVLIEQLHLKDALISSMDAELKVRGITFEQVNDELLVHEIGHYLTHLQEDFMPLGLHIFGKPWSPEAVQTMMTSIQSGNTRIAPDVRRNLVASPAHEMQALLHALSGKFVSAGPGNDPIRNPETLPTGRNFHGLDNSLLPSQLGYALGEQLAVKARAKIVPEGKEAIVLWASDSVRDEGAMVAFGMALLGVVPQWNSRGIVTGLQRRDLKSGDARADTVFVTSGLFRDLFGAQMGWLDKSVLLAIDGSRGVIEQKHPELRVALAGALAPLGPLERSGSESLERNHIARHWVVETLALMQSGTTADDAGKQSALRVFGTAPGDYGAGINRLAERSGSWTNRDELAKVYMERLGHTYAADGKSAPGRELFGKNLGFVSNTYLGRASNLYGLMDNNDAFDYLGGLSLAVEKVSGKLPASYVVDHSNADNPQMQPLPAALVAELRGRYLNPAWIKPLMQHGYAGARTMGSEFVEYLWGWQVTNPDIIKSWAWDEVKAVYIDDRNQLGLDKFLERDDNVHVKTNMMAILLVAAEKNFWATDKATLEQLSQQWVDLLLQHGLPGSGHTRPDHPVFQYVQPFLRADQREPLRQLLERSKAPVAQAQKSPSTISELQVAKDAKPGQQPSQTQAQSESGTDGLPSWRFAVLLLGILLIIGFLRGRYDHAGPRQPRTSP